MVEQHMRRSALGTTRTLRKARKNARNKLRHCCKVAVPRALSPFTEYLTAYCHSCCLTRRHYKSNGHYLMLADEETRIVDVSLHVAKLECHNCDHRLEKFGPCAYGASVAAVACRRASLVWGAGL